MQRDRQHFIEQARQRKARALSSAILSQYPDEARSDMETLIAMLMNYTTEQWGRLASLAECNPPSMATCHLVFANLRARRDFEDVRSRTWALLS